MGLFDGKHEHPQGPVQVIDPSMGQLLEAILTEMQVTNAALKASKPELVVIGVQGYQYSTYNFRNSVLYAQSAGTVTVTVAGFSYNISIVAGPNQVDFPDNSRITSQSPLTGYLVRDNHPRVEGTQVAITQPLPTGSNVIGQVSLSGITNKVVPSDTNGNVVYVGTKYETSDGNIGDNALTSNSINQLFNGSGWDRQYSNTQGTLLASAARTSSTNSPNQTNFNAKGAQIFLNVSAASGTGGIEVQIVAQGTGGETVIVNSTPTPVTATGQYMYEIYPGIGSASGQVSQRTSGTIPRTWWVRVNAVDSSSYTYQVDYSLIN